VRSRISDCQPCEMSSFMYMVAALKPPDQILGHRFTRITRI
jgi:hypothetical protein